MIMKPSKRNAFFFSFSIFSFFFFILHLIVFSSLYSAFICSVATTSFRHTVSVKKLFTVSPRWCQRTDESGCLRTEGKSSSRLTAPSPHSIVPPRHTRISRLEGLKDKLFIPSELLAKSWFYFNLSQQLMRDRGNIKLIYFYNCTQGVSEVMNKI